MTFDNRKLLILDLDETLLHAAESPIGRECDCEIGRYYVYLRPGLTEFLQQSRAHFSLGLWSSANQKYLRPIIDRFFSDVPFEFVWGRERCTTRYDGELMTPYFVKDLKKIKRRGVDLKNVIMVDDTPQKLERNYGNLIIMKPFWGDSNDRELPKLMRYLERFSHVDDVRPIEKRGWRMEFN